MKKQLFFILFFSFLMFSGCKKQTDDTIEIVTAQEMEELLELDSIQMVDVRTPTEYEERYIANAQNIDYLSSDFEVKLQSLDKTKPVIVYCKSGNRSAKCAKKMKDAGFVKVYDLEGGIAEWKFEDQKKEPKTLEQ